MKRNDFVLSLCCIVTLALLSTSCGGGAFTNTSNGGGNSVSNPSVMTTSMPAATVGSAYVDTLQATGGTAPYTWSLKSGALPTGVTLSANGTISGTPTTAGTSDSLVFEVSDAKKNSANSSDLSIKVNPEVPPVILTSALQNGNVGVSYSTTLTATGGVQPYIWSVKSGTLPDGLSLNSTTGAITGVPTEAGTFNSLVFAVSDFYNTVGNSGNFTVKIDPVVQVSTASLPNGTQGTAYTGTLLATGGSGTYTWSLQSGSLPPGLSLNASTGVISGIPSTANIFNGLVFEATDADSATGISGPLSVHVYNTAGCSAGAESNLGTQPYAFLLKGFEPGSANLAPVTLVGSFTPDGKGGITEGEEDVSGTLGAQSINPSGSGYSLGADNIGCLSLVTSAGTTTFHFSLSTPNGSGVFTKGRIILDDGSGTGPRGSGILRLQNASAFAAGLNGMYAFLFSGTDAASGHFGMTGSFTAAGPNISNVAMDADDEGTILTNLTGGNGTFSAADAYGRGTASLIVTNSGYNYSLGTVYYIVSGTEVLFASTDPLSTNPICGGEAWATAGPFSAASLQNSYVVHGTGLALTGAPVPVIAAAVFDGIGTITSGSLIQDLGGSVSYSSLSATYTVDASTGRVVFNGEFAGATGYLVTGFPGVSGVVIGDNVEATTGIMEPQQANPQPAAGIYSFGTDENADYLTANQVGTFNLSSSNFSGTENLSSTASPFLLENQAVSSSFSFAGNGIGSFWNNDAVSTGSSIYFINEGGGANTNPSIIAMTK